MSSLTFRTLTAETIDVTLIESESGIDPLRRSILRQTIEVSWEQYEQIAAGEWFNFHAVLRPPTAERILEAGLPVRLVMGLRAPLRARLSALLESVSDEEIPDLLGRTPNGNYTFIADTESWIIYEVKQPLPSLEGVAAGFKTNWRLEREPISLTAEVMRYFNDHQWNFERVKENLYRATVGHDEVRWLILIQIDTDHHYLMIYSVLPAFVPEARRPAMLFALNDLNYSLAVGNFELDTEDGELRFRTSADVEGTHEISALMHQLLTGNIATLREYLPLLQEIIRGE